MACDNFGQEKAFDDELDRLINRFADEFDLSVCQVIGLLEAKKHQLLTGEFSPEEEDEDEG